VHHISGWARYRTGGACGGADCPCQASRPRAPGPAGGGGRYGGGPGAERGADSRHAARGRRCGLGRPRCRRWCVRVAARRGAGAAVRRGECRVLSARPAAACIPPLVVRCGCFAPHPPTPLAARRRPARQMLPCVRPSARCCGSAVRAARMRSHHTDTAPGRPASARTALCAHAII
jgi:hypothetical protein